MVYRCKGGITEENLKKLISHAEIPERDECIIRNMTKLNIQIFSEANKNVRKGQVAKKDRSADVKYQLSRFTPAVKDIMEVKYLYGGEIRVGVKSGWNRRSIEVKFISVCD